MATKKLEYVPMEDALLDIPEGCPRPWRVEALNRDTGEVYIAIFYDPLAQERAIEYAQFKNNKLPLVKILPLAPLPPGPEKPPKTLFIMTQNNGEMILYLDSVVWSYDKKRKHVRAVSKHGIQPIVDNPRSLGA